MRLTEDEYRTLLQPTKAKRKNKYRNVHVTTDAAHFPSKREARVANPHIQALLWQIDVAGLPVPVTEYRFWPGRRFAADIAWPSRLLLVEVEGIVYPGKRGDGHLKGRHVSVKGFLTDIEKYGEATANGFRVLRVTPKHIQSGRALGWIERAIGDSRHA